MEIKARSPVRRDRQIGSVARCGLTRFFKHPIQQLSQVRALRLNRVRELHGTRIRLVKLLSSRLAAAGHSVGAVLSRKFDQAMWSGFRREKNTGMALRQQRQ